MTDKQKIRVLWDALQTVAYLGYNGPYNTEKALKYAMDLAYEIINKIGPPEEEK